MGIGGGEEKGHTNRVRGKYQGDKFSTNCQVRAGTEPLNGKKVTGGTEKKSP